MTANSSFPPFLTMLRKSVCYTSLLKESRRFTGRHLEKRCVLETVRWIVCYRRSVLIVHLQVGRHELMLWLSSRSQLRNQQVHFRQPHSVSETTGDLVTLRELLAKQNSPLVSDTLGNLKWLKVNRKIIIFSKIKVESESKNGTVSTQWSEASKRLKFGCSGSRAQEFWPFYSRNSWRIIKRYFEIDL